MHIAGIHIMIVNNNIKP